jgi:hypothetical protein
MSFSLSVCFPTVALQVCLDERIGTAYAPERAKRFESASGFPSRKGMEYGPMDVRTYGIFLQFNQGLDQALTSLGILQKLALEFPSCITKIRVNLNELCSYASDHFVSKIAQKQQEEENNIYRLGRSHEKAEESRNEIHVELKSREKFRREQGLEPGAVILPWTQADDDCILAMQKAASSSLPIQREQARITGDSEQKGRKEVR